MDITKFSGAQLAAIAKLAKIEPKQVNGLIEMASKQKMLKPLQAFKSSVAKLDKKAKRAFTLVEEAKGSYLFVDMAFPLLKKDLTPLIQEQQKALGKAKDQEKEGLEAYIAFLEALLDRVKKKKMSGTYGNMKFSKNEDGKCYMYPVGLVKGLRKSSLHEVVNPLNLVSKTGHTICFLDPKEAPEATEDEETVEGETPTDATDTTDATGEEATGADDASSAADENGDGDSRKYKRLHNAFEKVKGKLAEWKAETDTKKKANRVKRILKGVEKVLEHVQEFLEKDDNSEADVAGATDMQGKLESYKATLAKLDANVDQKKGEATVKGMDELFATIKADANSIKGEHGDEINSISDDFASILDELLA